MKAGDLFFVSSGEYSDYQIEEFLKAQVDFDFTVVVRQYASALGFKKGMYLDNVGENFAAWLKREGFAVETPQVAALHIGAYGRVDESWLCDHAQRVRKDFGASTMEVCPQCHMQFHETREWKNGPGEVWAK